MKTLSLYRLGPKPLNVRANDPQRLEVKPLHLKPARELQLDCDFDCDPTRDTPFRDADAQALICSWPLT